MKDFGCACHCIGVIEAERKVRIYNSEGQLVKMPQQGFQHF